MVEEVVTVGRSFTLNQDNVALDAEAGGACNPTRHVKHPEKIRIGLLFGESRHKAGDESALRLGY